MGKKDMLVKKIDSYKDLKNSKAGEFILVNGVLQLVIDSDSEYIKRFDYHPDKFYTVSLEGEYIVQNHYDNYVHGNDDDLKPFMKTSCKIGSNTALEDELSKIAKKGGLL